MKKTGFVRVATKMIKKNLYVFLAALYSIASSGQNLYPEKFDGCITVRFCLDCGTPKVVIPDDLDTQLTTRLDRKSLKSITGEIEIQVLIDSTGIPCLLSAQNRTNIKAVNSIFKMRLTAP